MSKIRDKARQVAERGEETRKTRPANGVPLRMYRWWLENSKSDRSKENLCHYGRVVAIWAPLLAVRLFLKWLFTRHATWIMIVAAYVTALVIAAFVDPVNILAMIVAPLIAVGTLTGVVVSFLLHGEKWDVKVTLREWWVWPMLILSGWFIPIGLFIYIVCYMIGAFFTSNWMKRFGRWLRYARLVQGHVSPLSAFFYLLYAAVVVALAATGLWYLATIMLGLAIAVVVLILLVRWVATAIVHSQARREDAAKAQAIVQEEAQYALREKQAVVKLEPLFRRLYGHYHHVAPSADSADYDQWLARYSQWRVRFIEYTDRVYVQAGRNSASNWQSFSHAPLFMLYNYAHVPSWALEQIIGQPEGAEDVEPDKRRKRVRKRRVRKFFTGVWDFIVLGAQWIYAMKKKICPYIEIPAE